MSKQVPEVPEVLVIQPEPGRTHRTPDPRPSSSHTDTSQQRENTQRHTQDPSWAGHMQRAGVSPETPLGKATHSAAFYLGQPAPSGPLSYWSPPFCRMDITPRDPGWLWLWPTPL